MRFRFIEDRRVDYPVRVICGLLGVSPADRKTLQSAGAQASMSRKTDCYDNAPMESFFHTLKTKLVHHRHYATRGAELMPMSGAAGSRPTSVMLAEEYGLAESTADTFQRSSLSHHLRLFLSVNLPDLPPRAPGRLFFPARQRVHADQIGRAAAIAADADRSVRGQVPWRHRLSGCRKPAKLNPSPSWKRLTAIHGPDASPVASI
jgi:hypothetical protein